MASRPPEVSLWIAVVSEALSSAEKLSRGAVPDDKPSRVPATYRGQLQGEIRNLHHFIRSTGLGSLAWIASVCDATVGPGLCDAAAITKRIKALLLKAHAHTIPRTAKARLYALTGSKTMPLSPVSRQDHASARILRSARTQGEGATRGMGQGEGGPQMARAADKGVDPRTVSVPVRRMR